jgi:hypothetical protein
MDFLYRGVGDRKGSSFSGLVGMIIKGEEERVAVAVEEVDDTFQACGCALGGGRLGVAERLRCGELFRIPPPRFRRNRMALRALACFIWLIASSTTSSPSGRFGAGCVAGLVLGGRLFACAGATSSPWVARAVFLGAVRNLGAIVTTISKKVRFCSQ